MAGAAAVVVAGVGETIAGTGEEIETIFETGEMVPGFAEMIEVRSAATGETGTATASEADGLLP